MVKDFMSILSKYLLKGASSNSLRENLNHGHFSVRHESFFDAGALTTRISPLVEIYLKPGLNRFGKNPVKQYPEDS